jgi:putative transposase
MSGGNTKNGVTCSQVAVQDCTMEGYMIPRVLWQKSFSSSRAASSLAAVDVVPEFRTVLSWTKLALKFPTRGDEEHERKRYTEEQITYTLRQAECVTPVTDVCRQLGVSEANFYLWKKKYDQLGMTEIWEMRQQGDANARLKRLVAELTLDKPILGEVVQKKL